MDILIDVTVTTCTDLKPNEWNFVESPSLKLTAENINRLSVATENAEQSMNVAKGGQDE